MKQFGFALALLSVAAICSAQTPGDFKPAETNVWGAEYPRVDGTGRVEIRIKAPEGFYDYDAKYKGQKTEYHFDLGLPPEVVEHVRELARKAHHVTGCRDLSRVDMTQGSRARCAPR